jgi:tellurite resistance protein TehA-like permease
MAMPAPPSGELDHSNRQTEFIVVVMLFTVVATVFVLARIYTRVFLVKSLGKGMAPSIFTFFELRF